MYRNIYLCPKFAVVSDNSRAPVNGNKSMGRREVTAMGILSNIHQQATQDVHAKAAIAC